MVMFLPGPEAGNREEKGGDAWVLFHYAILEISGAMARWFGVRKTIEGQSSYVVLRIMIIIC